MTHVQPARPKGFRKRSLLYVFLLLWVVVAAWHVIKPMPAGTDVRSLPVQAENVEFLADLTYVDESGRTQHEQTIFDTIFKIIDESQSFIVADFFLFNSLMGAADTVHRPLSRELMERLVARKRAVPTLRVVFITDPINDIYGGADSRALDQLRAAGVEVVTTNLERLRDSNPSYSALWRMLGQWWGNAPNSGFMPNPFGQDPQRITLRSYFALLNFKANHRKLVIADRADGEVVGLVTSANPHDGSSAHSNVAVKFEGPFAVTVLRSELAVARFSGWTGADLSLPSLPALPEGDVSLTYLTEQAIREHLLTTIALTRQGDAIDLATFYLSERSIIEALLAAAQRGVAIRLILDPNKDAFGREKDGVPNRPVANELVEESDGRIQIRWYATHGEQFHTKLAMVVRGDRFAASLGSANLTRRNIGNYNLEANVAIESAIDASIAREMRGYYDRLWNNKAPSGATYTVPLPVFHDDSALRYARYRFMEWSGLSTF